METDETRSFYRDKSHEVWLRRAAEHKANAPLAFAFGTREHQYPDELLTLPEPFNIGKVYADGNFAYGAKIAPENPATGKKDTQHIERNHLTLRSRVKRLARKTICFSKKLNIVIQLENIYQ